MNAIEKRQERAAIVREMVELSQANDVASADRWKQLDAQQESLRVSIEQTERASALNREMNTVQNPERPPVGDSLGDDGATTQRVRGPHYAARSSKAFALEFEHMLRTGELGREQRAIGVGGDGSTLVPTGFEAELIVKMKYYNGVSNICRHVATSTGNPLPWPNVDDTGNTGEWLAEAGGVGAADPTFSNITLGANLLSSKQVKYSVQLEQDSAFDLVGMLSDSLAQRLGRTQDLAYCIGDGTSTYGTITGIVPALVAATGRNVLAVGSSANDSVGTDINSVGTDDFSALIDRLDKAYQKPSNQFLLHQSTQNFLRKLKDRYGRPVWETSLAQGEPDKIFGFGYQVDNAMAPIAPGNISVVFGDFAGCYVVRDVLGFTLVLFRELYMGNYQRAVQAFLRTDAKLLQAAGFSYLIHPAS